MPASLLVVARAVQIGASLLLAGIFTFELIVLGPASRRAGDDWHRFDRRLFRLAFWSLGTALLSALLWFAFEVSNMTGLSLSGGLRRFRLADCSRCDTVRARLAVAPGIDRGVSRVDDSAPFERPNANSPEVRPLVARGSAPRFPCLDQPSGGRSRATARSVGRCTPSVGGRRVDGWAALPRDLSGDEAGSGSRSGSPALFCAQPLLCQRAHRSVVFPMPGW